MGRNRTEAKTEAENDRFSGEQARREPAQSSDGKGKQEKSGDKTKNQTDPRDEKKDPASKMPPARDEVDRPGFDLGGSTGDNSAGKGLGLGEDAKESRKSWRLPR